MEDKNNSVFMLQSTKSKLEIAPDSATESCASFENSKTSCNIQRMFVTVLDVINHTLIILVTTYLLYHAMKQYYVTNIHVILCTTGGEFRPSKIVEELITTWPNDPNFYDSILSFQHVLLMSEAIVALAGDNVLTNILTRRSNRHIHWILQMLGLICSLIGVGLMYNTKTVHFLSIHGIMGFTSLVIMCVLAIFGYPVMIVVKLRKFVKPVIVKLLHSFLGIACFVIGMVAQCYGYRKRWVYKTTKVENADMTLLVLTVLITILSLRGALVSLARHTTALLRLIQPSTS